MYQNTKKTILSTTRWSLLIDFLHGNQSLVKSFLRSGVDSDIMRTDVFLDNVISGVPRLSVEFSLPGGGDKLLVCSLARPPLFDLMAMQRKIEELNIIDFLLTVSNQIEVVR